MGIWLRLNRWNFFKERQMIKTEIKELYYLEIGASNHYFADQEGNHIAYKIWPDGRWSDCYINGIKTNGVVIRKFINEKRNRLKLN